MKVDANWIFPYMALPNFVKVFVSNQDDIDILQNSSALLPHSLVSWITQATLSASRELKWVDPFRTEGFWMAKSLLSLKNMSLFPWSTERKGCFIRLKCKLRTFATQRELKIEIDTREKFRRLPKSFAEIYKASSYIAFLIIKMLVAKNIWGIIMFLCLANRSFDNV